MWAIIWKIRQTFFESYWCCSSGDIQCTKCPHSWLQLKGKSLPILYLQVYTCKITNDLGRWSHTHFQVCVELARSVPDLILGSQVLTKTKVKLHFDAMETDWLGDKVPFHPQKYFCDNFKLYDLLCNDPVWVRIAESYMQLTSTHYKDSIYEVNAGTNQVAYALKHLTLIQ
jgi:hypothetical protein